MNNVLSSWSEQKFPKMYSKQQKSPQLLNKAMGEQSTCFICITYQGKQNGSVLLTNEQLDQLERTQTLWAAQQISLKIVLTFE